MAVEILKCKTCGGDLSFEHGNNTGFCPHCGTKYVNNVPVNSFITNVNNNYSGANFVVANNEKERICEAASTFCRVGEYSEAEKKYEELINYAPQDCIGWWGRAYAISHRWQTSQCIHKDYVFYSDFRKAEKD